MTPSASGSPGGSRRPRRTVGAGLTGRDPGAVPESPAGALAAGSVAAGSVPVDAGAESSAGGAERESTADGAGRPTGLRLARVHLRMGSLLLARAELEAFAGRGALDEGALLDLAETRWRTGDLTGAGEAASALLERGRDDVVALVIAAEATAQQGRPGEARRLAGRALAGVHGSLDPLFAGMPRSPIWPADAASIPSPGGAPPVLADPVAHLPARRRAAVPVTGPGDDEVPASPAAAEAFAGGLAALGSDDLAAAALRLGVALRLEPGFAEGVLEAIGDRASESGLALVAGDALRLLGREAEALAAFDVARGRGPASLPPADDPGTRPEGGAGPEAGTRPEGGAGS